MIPDPHIEITPALARAFYGAIFLSPPPDGHSGNVGNLDQEYVAYMAYNYGVQQAQDLVGVFRPYLLFGMALGNTVLEADPTNSVNGTIPRFTTDIASTTVSIPPARS